MFAPAPSVRRLQLGERAALFCDRRQQLYELNPTADVIWLGLSAGMHPTEIARELGSNTELATLEFIRQAAAGWVRSGFLVPDEVARLLSGKPHARWTFELDELRLGLTLFGQTNSDDLVSVFGQFLSQAPAARSISAVGHGGLIFLFEGDEPLGALDESAWLPELKARLTERYAQAALNGFLTHGALLSRADRRLLLCGNPGAGKTTLAIALMQAGFDYHSDDIVRFDERGMATGAPFSPAVKRGAWELLKDVAPGLGDLPVHMRSDGQAVKYLPVSPAVRKPARPSVVLLLQRQADEASRIEPVEPLDLLTAILGAAYSPRGRIDADVLGALAETMNETRGGRLIYSDLNDAVREVSAFLS